MSLPSIVNKNKPMDDSLFIKNPITTPDTHNDKKNDPPFWTDDPNILFQKNYIFEFYPTDNMTYNQKLNTITRVVLILSIILTIFTRNMGVLIVAGITIFSIILIHKNNNKKRKSEGYANPTHDFLKRK